MFLSNLINYDMDTVFNFKHRRKRDLERPGMRWYEQIFNLGRGLKESKHSEEEDKVDGYAVPKHSSDMGFDSIVTKYDVTGGWRKLHNEELHNLYSSPNIIRMIKSSRTKWAGHVARTGAKRNAYVGGKARRKENTIKANT
jgi:hypothetical protein